MQIYQKYRLSNLALPQSHFSFNVMHCTRKKTVQQKVALEIKKTFSTSMYTRMQQQTAQDYTQNLQCNSTYKYNVVHYTSLRML